MFAFISTCSLGIPVSEEPVVGTRVAVVDTSGHEVNLVARRDIPHCPDNNCIGPGSPPNPASS